MTRFASFNPQGQILNRSRMLGVEDILSCHEEWIEQADEGMSAPALYHLAEKIVGDLTYQADEISLFCQQVLKMEVNRHMPLNGLFLSLLINKCPESGVHLRLGENGAKIDYLGYRNQRELFIQGDAGSFVGQGMQAGQIKISGTAKGLGRVRGGTIYSGDKLLYPRGLSKITTAFRWLWQILNKRLNGFGRK